jgi:hypothetical protein
MGVCNSVRALIDNPAVRQFQNCVSFATGDVFAVPLRGAGDRGVVIPAIARAAQVTHPRDNDIAIWYNADNCDSAYHFGRIYRGRCLMMMGMGGDYVSYAISDAAAELGKFYAHNKRVRRLKLPLLPIYAKRHNSISTIYKWYKNKEFDKVASVFEAIHRRHNNG